MKLNEQIVTEITNKPQAFFAIDISKIEFLSNKENFPRVIFYLPQNCK